MSQPQRALAPHCLRPVVIALALVGAGASAETDPYYIGVSQGFTHQSNVFQQVTVPQSDTISSTGVFGGLDLHLGRQHVFANGSAQANRYSRFDQLNNVSYGLSTGVDWQTIERLSGDLRYSTNQSLANYADVQFPVSVKDVQRTQAASAGVRYGITPRLAIEAGASHRSVDYSAAEDTRDYRLNSANLGLRWGGPVLSLGAAARFTKGDFPTALIVAPIILPPPSPVIPGVYGPDKSDRKDLDLTGSWVASGLSTVNARISLTRETHTQPTIPDFSGVTGSVSWDYRPTGKISLMTSLTRDTGAEATFAALPINLTALRPDNTRVNTVFDLQARYEATAKILVNAGVRYLNGNILNSNGTSGRSSTTDFTLGANYSVTRAIQLGCDIGYQTRSNSYNASSVGCTGRLTLR